MHTSIDGQYFFKDRTLKSVNFFNSEPDLDELSVYEVFRVEDSVPLFLEDHLKRFAQSANVSGEEINKSNSQIKRAINTLVAANTIANGNIKIDFRISKSGERQFLVHYIKVNYPEIKDIEGGVVACFQEAVRTDPSAKIYNTKVRGQANSILDEKHVYETLLVNKDGLLTEGSRSNLFFIKGDTVITAADNMVLSGIIRGKVIELIKDKGIAFNYEALSKEQINDIDAAFITGTTPRILPLRQIEQTEINPQHPFIKSLQAGLENYIELFKESYNK